jgi:hypothetical protein
MEQIDADANGVSKAIDFTTKKLLSQVQKTGSYHVLKSKLAKKGAASFLYKYRPGLIRYLLDYPTEFPRELADEIYHFLVSKQISDYLFMVTGFDATKNTCTVLVYDERRPYRKMNSRRIRQFSKKPLLPTELR